MGEAPRRMTVSPSTPLSANTYTAAAAAASGNKQQHEEVSTVVVVEKQPQDGNNNGTRLEQSSSSPPAAVTTATTGTAEDDGTVSHESTASTRTATTTNTDHYSSHDDDEDDHDHEEEEEDDDAPADDDHPEQQQQQEAVLLLKVLQTAVDWKVEGNAAFSNKNYQQALEAYQRGLTVLAAEQPPVVVVDKNHHNPAVTDNGGNSRTSNLQQQQQQLHELKMNLSANCAMALIRLHQFQQAQQVCTSLLLQQQQQSDGNNSNNGNSDHTKDYLTLTKVWYRRALARQGQALAILAQSSSSSSTSTTNTTSSSTPKAAVSKNKTTAAADKTAAAARDLLLAAKSDLQQALALVEELESSSSSSSSSTTLVCPTTIQERNGLKQTVAILAKKIQDTLELLKNNNNAQPKKKPGPILNHVRNRIVASGGGITTGNGDTTAAIMSNGGMVSAAPMMKQNNNAAAVRPEPAKQRHDIIRLLLSRQMGLQQQQQQRPTALPGEAFFLVDAHWWTRFCHHVDFFYTQSNNNNSGNKNGKNGAGTSTTPTKTTTGPVSVTITTTNLTPIQTKLLGYLPPGAILPEIYNDSDKNDDASSTSSSDSDEDDDNRVHHGPEAPGPIDNTRLLLLPPRAASSSTPRQTPLAVVGNEEGDGNVKSKRTTTCKTREIFLRHWYRPRRPLNSVSPALVTSSSSSNHGNGTTRMNGDDASQQQQQQQQQPLLSPSLVRGYHYEILPREVYNAVREWYGEVTPSLCRRATILETAEGGAARIAVPLYPTVGPNVITAPPSLHQTNSNHEVPQPSCGACRAPRVGLRCTRCSVVYYCDRACQESHWHLHKNECKTIQQYKQQIQEHQQELDSSSSTATTLPLPAELLPIADGRVGLNNLGNTCFMNSALQCLSHATPLTRLFLSGNFRLDVNQSNTLGTGGKLAHAYEAVMKELWMRDAFGATSAATRRGKSTSPVALKRAIALFAPRFAGHLQHDAQEFLAYLLDGLHEDLNRIRQAPYVEMPDVTDGQNMHVAGARAWDAHRRRNDSLVMDTFYGQFKSTCVCPRCNRVSVSFDAFNHVSLEIPQQNAIVPVGVVVCRAPTGSSNAAMMKPIRYSVLMRQDSPIPDLKQELSKLCGIPPSHLHLCSVAEQEILCIYRDNQLVSHIKNLTVAYEAEPFSNAAFPSFHVIAKHKVVTKSLNSAISAAEEDNDEAALADAVGTSDNDFIGIPILTSFPADSTCRQVFQHFWEIVQDKLPDGEMDRPEDIMQVRLRNGRGQPLAVFPNHSVTDATSAPLPDAEEDKEQEKNENCGRTSLFPKDLDEPVVRFLGEAAIESFVSVWIEWNETICEANDCNFDVGRFSLVNNHPSWFEAEERQRAIVTRGVTLDQCFETFTKPERLDEHNMWYCSKCKDHVRAMKTMELWRLPNVLIVHLKRFEFKNVLRRDKLDTLVDFPLEGLDMSNHCASDRDSNFVDQTVPAIYDLFAVTNHYGRMGFGHYTAFAREFNEDGISDAWGLFDDSSVRSVGDGNDSVVSPAAYVLFYRRRTFS